jgi:hypothetical protein
MADDDDDASGADGPDDFTETTHESWLGRMGRSFMGILVGLVLICVAVGLLWWNEGRTVERYRTLQEGKGQVISLQAQAPVDPAQGGKLVHVAGPIQLSQELADPDLGVKQKAVKLKRTVKMYQWQEKKEETSSKTLGGGKDKTTHYNYTQAWVEGPVDSNKFKHPEDHQNPAASAMPYKSQEFTATDVRIGARRLSPSLIGRIGNFQPLPLAPTSPLPLPPAIASKTFFWEGGLYVGANPATPALGDLRIDYGIANPAEVSVIARQINDTFEPATESTGGTIELLEIGQHSAQEMFKGAEQENVILAWILRAVGFVLLWIGLALLAGPLTTLLDVLPLLGDIAEVGVGIMAFVVAAILALLTIGVSWVVHRPLLGIGLLAGAALLVVAAKFGFRGRKGAVPA